MDRDEPHRAPVAQVTAIGASVTVMLGDNRNIVMQTHFAADATDEECNAVLDRILMLADRQKARYDLEKLEEEFHLVGRTLGNLIDGLPHAERNHQAEKARRTIALEEKQAARKEAFNKMYEGFTAAGRSGSFVPKGYDEQRLKAMDADIEKAVQSVAQISADKDQHRQELEKSVLHYQQDLRTRRTAINKKRALFGGKPEAEYLDLEDWKMP